MSDIAFQCHNCAKNLAVGDGFIGVTFACPDCHSQLTVPSPHRVFPCPSCGNSLFGDQELCGQIYGCPECETLFTVPLLNTLRCGGCGVHLEIEDEDYNGVAGTEVECPQCNAPVEAPIIPALIIEEEAPPTPSVGVQVECPGCKTEISLQPEAYARDLGKLIRCPKCKHFLRVPAGLAGSDPGAPAPPSPVPHPPRDAGPTDIKATMRMDSLLESIPQGRRIQEGHCLYCNLPTRRLDAHTFVCENCRRVFKTIKHRHGNIPRR